MAHITVCICTYARLSLLKRLLIALSAQKTDGLFTYSIVVADNDAGRSAEPVVRAFAKTTAISVTYSVEPRRNIALARNLAVMHATGDYIAFIDDDECPGRDWLLRLFQTCTAHDVDGTLGPVRPAFEAPPPKWLLRGKFFERPEHCTGARISWPEARTGNVLLRTRLFGAGEKPFREQFGSGSEDTDFFRRMAARGHAFNWCNEAVVYETVPPARWTRHYLLKRALLRGQNYKGLAGLSSVARSLLAVPAYSILLPFLLLIGQHHFMRYLIKLCDHTGKLLAFLSFRPAGDKYT
jgi:glycosyltransferase involved in cell wall biosynthesis